MNNSIYLTTIDNNIYNENQIVEFISNDITKTKFKYDFNKLKDIDDRGIFEKDDDVGFLFSDLKQIIESLNKKIKEEETDNV